MKAILPPGMTWLDLARHYLPDYDDGMLDWVLWAATCFPLGGAVEVEKDLIQFKLGTAFGGMFVEADPEGVYWYAAPDTGTAP